MRSQFISSIHAIAPEAWQALWCTDYPFIQHAFLALLEDSGCTSAQTGWQPHHLLLWQGDVLVGAMPLFIKTHSYGEYVFDWRWAEAYQHHQLAYYPKLVAAVPFTPATGPRLALAPGTDVAALVQALTAEAERLGASSWHCLFPAAEPFTACSGPLIERLGCQFHWFNQGYREFDDFLAQFSARKRKTLLRERRKALESGLVISVCDASDLDSADWQAFYRLYQNTYHKRSQRQGYLRLEFFAGLAAALPGQVQLVCARGAGLLQAAALYFSDSHCLYGRYWGALTEFDSLHFECCYYQGVELAIVRGLQRFDPGAQGEHKIARGFTPVLTHSYHQIMHAEFGRAIADFCQQEALQIRHYCSEMRQRLPFKADVDGVSPEVLIRRKV